jgi:hypothetical protein
MTHPGGSDIEPAGAKEMFYAIAEYSLPPGYLMSVGFVFLGKSDQEAAEAAAGMQLGRECIPRRILVYRGQPVTYEWKRVDNYLCELGPVQL